MSGIKGLKDKAKELEVVATREISEIHRNFAALRDLGVVTSPYPQSAFCRSLGVTVREIRIAA